MRQRNLFAATLAALLLLPSFAGCAKENDGTPETTPAVTAPAETTAPAEETPRLAFAEEDNKGKSFHILTCSEADYEYRAEEETGERVNDAIYARNAAVEDYLGVKLDVIYESGAWANRAAYNALIMNSIAAGDHAYDYVTGMISCIQPIASTQLFWNLFEVPNLDMDNEWWVSSMQDELSLNGKLFGIIGDVCLSMYKGLSVILFNKDLIENNHMENPYELVRTGKWTLDKYLEQTAGHGSDANGDGVYELGTDAYNCLLDGVVWRSMNAALDIHSAKVGEDGVPVVVDPDDRLVDTVARLQNYLAINPDVKWVNSDTPKLTAAFAADQAIYYMTKLQEVEKLGDMESDFGVIPMAKYDENQKEYYTQIATATQMIFVPVTTDDVALTGKVLEALSFFSWDGVIGAYYDTALKQRYSRDPDTPEMLEIIRRGAVNGFDYSYSTAIGGFLWVNKTVSNDARSSADYNPASQFAKDRPTWEANIQKIFENYSDAPAGNG